MFVFYSHALHPIIRSRATSFSFCLWYLERFNGQSFWWTPSVFSSAHVALSCAGNLTASGIHPGGLERPPAATAVYFAANLCADSVYGGSPTATAVATTHYPVGDQCVSPGGLNPTTPDGKRGKREKHLW